MNRLLGCLLMLFFLAGLAHPQESFEINTKAQWETWDFPVGTLNIRDDGKIKPIRFEQPFNAAPGARVG